MSVSFALIAELATIDGKPLVFEDILEMDLDDVLALEEEVSGAGENQLNFPVTAVQQKGPTDLSQRRQSSDLSVLASPLQSCE